MASKQVVLPDIGTITLTKRSTSKNIRLSYSSAGNIKVSLPRFVPYQVGIDFVKKNREWLDRHKPDEPEILEQDDRIGKAHRIIFSYSPASKRPSARVTNTRINITLPEGMSHHDQQAQLAAIKAAHRALTKEAKQLLPQRLERLAKDLGFSYSSITVKKLTSRWGSCSQLGDITLNIYLLQLPWELIDYVLIHELVHTEHMNHSTNFWNRFIDVRPDAKQLRKQLKQYQTTIKPLKQ